MIQAILEILRQLISLITGEKKMENKPKEPEERIYSKDDTMLAWVLFGEARGEHSLEIYKAIAWSVRNRVDSGKPRYITYEKAIGTGCWSGYGQGKDEVGTKDGKIWFQNALDCAFEVIRAKRLEDITNGSTHYYDDSIPAPDWTKPTKDEPEIKLVLTLKGEMRSYMFYNGYKYY